MSLDYKDEISKITKQYVPISKSISSNELNPTMYLYFNTTLIENPKFEYDLPQEIIIKHKHLEKSYLDDILKEKNLTTEQIQELEINIHEYIKRFTKNEDIKLNEESYKALINMIIYLIESAKEE